MRPESRLWWRQSIEDMETARINLEAKRFYACVFFSHQAAEKGLKALFIDKMLEMPTKTHNIIALGKALDAPDSLMTSIRDLSPEYITSRYPDAAYGVPADLYNEELAQKHLKQAEEILKWIKPSLE